MFSGDSRHPHGESRGSCETAVARPRAALDDAERELAVLSALLKSFTAWECLARGGERLLGELGAALGQMAGVLWLAEQDALRPRASWSMLTLDGGALARPLGEVRIPRGVGLAGCAWERQTVLDRLEWSEREDRSRCEESPHGLEATIALPCWSGEEVLAVVELYSTAQAQLSSYLLGVLASVGHDLGVFLARRRGELRPTPLSPRETEILVLAAAGHSVRSVADQLTISPATVKSHLEHIYRKLGVRDRTAAVAQALRAGFID